MRIRSLASGLVALALTVSDQAAPTAPDKSTAILAAARKAIGDRKLESLKTLSVEASLQRNVNTMQLTSEVEILLELPDKYLRSDVSSGGPMGGGFSIGFNGDKPIRPANSGSLPGGGMMIRMGPGGARPPGEKLSPEEQQKADAQMLRSARADVSRLMLGWFATAHPTMDAQYTYAGEAESPDGKAHVIDAKTADGFAARLFIDQESHLPLMVTYQGPQPRMITAGGPRSGGPGTASERRAEARELTDEERKKAREDAEKQLQALQQQPPAMVEFTLFFDDWREVGGVKFPHKMRRASAGATNEEWTVTRVKVNPKFDAKKFEG
jgi:hypothetical protein